MHEMYVRHSATTGPVRGNIFLLFLVHSRKRRYFFEGNFGETVEIRGGARMGLFERRHLEQKLGTGSL